jgi:putative tryptophan/tyrosine transport system substrate-binding protein
LQKLGWTDGDNVRTDVRWAAADMELFRKYAEELVELNPHVILASASPAVAELQRVTRSVPIVFANVVDPVGAGFIPGGKISNYLYYGRRVGGQDKRRG